MRAHRPDNDWEDRFEEWYSEYPHKVRKPAAKTAYRSALARAGPAVLLLGLRRYIKTKPPDRQWRNPSTFLKDDSWLDQPATTLPTNGSNRDGRRGESTPAEKLFAGFYEASADSRSDCPADNPLLDR